MMRTERMRGDAGGLLPRRRETGFRPDRRGAGVRRPAALVGLAALALTLAAPAPARDGFGQNMTDRAQQGASPARSEGEREVARARADIKGEGLSGTAEFVEVESGTGRLVRVTVRIKGEVSKLTPGLHGVHIHEKGVCEAPYTSAGGHFDPGPAGNSDPDVNHPFHMGDLPNIRVGSDGSGVLEATTTRITLSEGPLSLFDADGSAIIIHGQQDQMTSGAPKSGVSGGPRLACGLIRRQ